MMSLQRGMDWGRCRRCLIRSMCVIRRPRAQLRRSLPLARSLISTVNIHRIFRLICISWISRPC